MHFKRIFNEIETNKCKNIKLNFNIQRKKLMIIKINLLIVLYLKN